MRFTENIQIKGNLNSKLNRGPIQTAQISEPPQVGGGYSINYVMTCGVEKAIL